MMEARSVNAVPHLAGRRISLSWTIPGAGEFPSGVSLKRVRLVRRERTFPLDPTDGSIVYDGAVTSSFDDGRAGEKLLPITIYYYTVFTQDSATNWHWSTESQAAALASDDYSLPDRLYRMLPAIHQRDDLPLGPTDLASLSPQIITALNSLPIRLQNRGQLYRFMQALAAPANLLRSTAEALPQIQNVDLATPAFLVSLGESIDWELDRTQPVYSQRNEIRFAPSVFRTVGTVPNLRALVNRYSGWYVQVAEFAQSIARSNWPAMLNVFGVETDGGRWRGTDDAAPALGFGLGNESAAGGISTPALLQSTSAEPFTLRPGMELAITADGRIPMAVRFRSGDFANIGAATADEVAAVINRAFSEVTATAIPTHHLVIASNTSGVTSSLDIEQATTSLVTIDGDVRGRVCPVVTSVDSLRRTRLFYSTGDPSDTVRSRAAELSVAGIQPSSGISDQPNTKFRQQAQEPFASVLGVGLTAGTSYTSLTLTSAPAAIRVGTQLRLLSGIDAQRVVVSLAVAPSKSSTLVQVMPFVAAATFGAGAATVDAGPARQQVHAKTFRGGQWGGSDAAGDSGFASAGEPAAVELSDGRIFLAWVDSPGSDASRLRFATATTTAPSAATITCNATAPFAIVPGSRLVLDGPGIDPVGFEFSAADFANPAIASLSEVLAALNTRLSNVSAAAGPLGTLELSTTAVGGDQFLQVDLGASDAASVLGIGPGNASAEGDWGDALSWSSPDDATSIGPGRYMDLAAVAVSGGRVLLVWASHEGAIWVLRGSIWDGTTWSVPSVLAGDGAGNREPCLALDAAGDAWMIWSQLSVGPAGDTWTLWARKFDPGTSTWSGPSQLTAAIAPRSADREPAAILLPSKHLAVFFSSDRQGGPDLWSLDFDPVASVISGQGTVMAGPSADHWPAPMQGPGGQMWVLYRSDRCISAARFMTRQIDPPDNRLLTQPAPPAPPRHPVSASVTDMGTLRRFAGTVSATPTDAARNGRRKQWDDLISYTPQKPFGPSAGEALADDDLYTRGTIGLYLSELVPSSPMSETTIHRLRPILDRFLPINVRAVVILAPRVDIEYVYGLGVDIGESYQDRYPFVEYFVGGTDSYSVALPDWSLLISNTLGDTSANPAALASLRHRSWYPPPS